MPLEGTTVIYRRDYDNYAVAPQRRIPACAPPAPECTLALTGSTTTNVTIRGAADGIILIGWTGSTGTTTTVINGVIDTTTADTYSFTGLQAGYYDIRITEGTCFGVYDNIQVIDGEFRTGDFITNQPVALTAAENPIVFNIQTARNQGTPLISKGDIDVNGSISDGDNMVFTLTYPQAYTAVFTAKAFPNRDTYFLASVLNDANGVAIGNNSAAEIVTSIAEVLSQDSVISRLYFIRADQTKVYLAAKEANTKLDITTVIAVQGTNLALTQTQNGNSAYDGQISENYSVYTDILINNSAQYGEDPAIDTFNKVAQLELPFNAITNQHLFDLSEVLKNFVSTPKIDFTLTGFTTIANMLTAYKVQYGEKYPLVENSSTKKSRNKGTSDTKFALNSALQWESDNDMTDWVGSRLHNVKADFDGVVITNSPTESEVLINDYLWDTGSTVTTGISFRFIDNENGEDSGWQTGNSYTFTGYGYYNGDIFITGITSGVTFNYDKDFWAYPTFGAGDIEGINVDPNIQSGLKFFTNSPNPKFIQRNSSEFLYLMLPKDYGKTLKIIADLYFYDGTSLTGETLYTVSTGATNYGGVFMFAAGYNELGLADFETYSGGTRNIRKVDFALYQNDAVNGDYLLSEEKSYRYEIDEQPRRYGVAFLNKLGTYDIFDFAGEIIDSVQHDNETYEVPRALNLQGGSPLGFQAKTVYNTKVTKTIAANTGWINEDHFDWLMELLESNRCYNYTETDQSFLVVESIDYSKSSNDDLYQIDVQFIETLYQNQISV